jgi:16S rRNA processing protein RimM
LSALEVGRVAKPHGIRGELKVELHWAGSDALLRVATVLLQRGQATGSRFVVQRARRSGRFALLKLCGVDDREAAESLRGAAVLVTRGDLPPLGPDECYLGDLVGALVLAPTGPVGPVVEVLPYPSVDVVVVLTPAGKRLEQPLAEPWVERVDAAAGRIYLTTTDGLIE